MAKSEYQISVASRGHKLDVFCQTDSGKKVKIFYIGTVKEKRLLRCTRLDEYRELPESQAQEYMNQLRTSVYRYIRKKGEQVTEFVHSFTYTAPRTYAK